MRKKELEVSFHNPIGGRDNEIISLEEDFHSPLVPRRVRGISLKEGFHNSIDARRCRSISLKRGRFMAITAAIVILAGVMCGLCGCGKANETGGEVSGENLGIGSETEQSGRYVESTIELPATNYGYADLVSDGETIRVAEKNGYDLVSTDGGVTFRRAENWLTGKISDRWTDIYKCTAAPDGSRIFSEYRSEKSRICLLDTEDRIVEIANPEGEGDFYPSVYYGGSSFYFTFNDKVYGVEADTGSVTPVYESAEYISYLAADEDMLYLAHGSGVLLYDLSQNEIAGRQDEVLNGFVSGESSVMFCPSGDGVYILTDSGLYWHTLYGESVDQVLDGSRYEMAAGDKKFVRMAVVEGKEEKDTFLILYSDGSLARYAYDPTLSAEEAVLRIYSVYEETDVRRAVNAYRQMRPEVAVKYEVAIRSENGMTLEDALKNLSTEIAAGNGPDILVMDDIPYASYVEKGVLVELSDLRDDLEGEYFDSVINGLLLNDSLYSIPISFTVPLIAAESGWTDKLEGIQDLSGLADLLETAREEIDDGMLLGFLNNEKKVLYLLAQSSMGAWLDGHGNLDRDALTEYYKQAKRIYDIQIAGVPEELRTLMIIRARPTDELSMLSRRFGVAMQGSIEADGGIKFRDYPESPFFAGYYSGYLEGDFGELNAYLQYYQADLFLLPGQRYNTGIPRDFLAINHATKQLDACREFLEYALSADFQKDTELIGIPINRDAYEAKKIDDRGEAFVNEPCVRLSGTTSEGEEKSLDVYWPTKEDYRKLDRILDGLSGVNICENKVYEAVVEKGQDVLNGSLSVEEAVNAVERKLQLYLSE